jgi:hypothetical protein
MAGAIIGQRRALADEQFFSARRQWVNPSPSVAAQRRQGMPAGHSRARAAWLQLAARGG